MWLIISLYSWSVNKNQLPLSRGCARRRFVIEGLFYIHPSNLVCGDDYNYYSHHTRLCILGITNSNHIFTSTMAYFRNSSNISDFVLTSTLPQSSSSMAIKNATDCVSTTSQSELYDNSTSPPEPWPLYGILLTTIPMSLLIFEIILGNLMVIVAVLTQRQLRTPSNMIILSLAVADLAVGIFILPFNIADMLEGWKFGATLCRIWLTLDVTLCSTSILHISAIAVDRFRSINEGVSYAQSRSIRMSIVVCGALWLIALWIASSPILGWNDWKPVDGSVEVMECALTKELGYIIHSASGAFFIPAIIMVCLYFRIFFLIRNKLRERSKIACVSRKSKSMFKTEEIPPEDHSSGDIVEDNSTDATKESIHVHNGKPKKSLDSTSSTSAFVSGDGPSKTRKKHSEQIERILKNKLRFSLTKERKAAQTLGIIIGAFIICWTPFTLVYLYSGIRMELYGEGIGMPLFQTVTWLGYVNSGINPIIYTIYNPDFRRAFKTILDNFRCIR